MIKMTGRWGLIFILFYFNSIEFTLAYQRINKLDTTFIDGSEVVAIQFNNDSLALLKEGVSLQYYTTAYPSFEFMDFDSDGYEDVVIELVGNIPGRLDVLLFDKISRLFKPIDSIKNYPEPILLDVNNGFFYSYSRNGCADNDWISFLFKIEDWSVKEYAKLVFVTCSDDEEKRGLFLIDSKSKFRFRVSTYEEFEGNDKWSFIREYWNENYKKYE